MTRNVTGIAVSEKAGPTDDAKEDHTGIIFEGKGDNRLACDTTLRKMPDGSWAMIMLGFGHTEPLPANRICISRSTDSGHSWSPITPVDLGVKAVDPNRALVPSELMVNGDRCTLVVSTHNGGFGGWKTFFVHSDDCCHTWSGLIPAPGRTAHRTFIRNHIVTSDGRLMMPDQHYLRTDTNARAISKGRTLYTPRNPRNGVIISRDGGKICCTIPIPSIAVLSHCGLATMDSRPGPTAAYSYPGRSTMAGSSIIRMVSSAPTAGTCTLPLMITVTEPFTMGHACHLISATQTNESHI